MHALLQVICVKLYVLYYYDSLVYVCYNIIKQEFSSLSITWTLAIDFVYLTAIIYIVYIMLGG